MQLAQNRKDALALDPSQRDAGPTSDLVSGDARVPAWGSPTLAEAKERLASVQQRAVTAAGNPGFIPTGAPSYVAEDFAAQVTNRAVVANLFAPLPLPAKGLQVSAARIAVGATVTAQASEAAASSTTDETSALMSAPVALITGQQNVSQQLLDRSSPGYDQVVAADLAAAYAARLDQQLLSGTGADGELLGLRSVTGLAATTYADGAPTPQKVRSNIGQGAVATATALGAPLEAVVAIAHPRRIGWIVSESTTAFSWPCRTVGAPSVPTTAGAGTEDLVVYVAPDIIRFHTAPPAFKVIVDSSLSGTLQVKLMVAGYCGFLPNRTAGAGIGTLSGSGLAAPSW